MEKMINMSERDRQWPKKEVLFGMMLSPLTQEILLVQFVYNMELGCMSVPSTR